MKLGLIMPHYGSFASKQAIAAMAVRAEQNGFDSIWVADLETTACALQALFFNVLFMVSTVRDRCSIMGTEFSLAKQRFGIG